MEHVVDGGEADVLVAAAVAGDEVRVEQLVVVAAVGCDPGLSEADFDVAVREAVRHRVVRDVGKEGVRGADRRQRSIPPLAAGCPRSQRRRRCSESRPHRPEDHCGKPFGPG